jgi:hypothetical protein
LAKDLRFSIILLSFLTCSLWVLQDDLGFKAEYVHPYVDGVDDPRNRTFRASCFNSRKLSAVFTGGPGLEEVPSVWVDRAGFKANLTEVSLILIWNQSMFTSIFKLQKLV